MNPSPSDLDAVGLALEVARAGPAEEVPIGAVVLDPAGRVIGTGSNERVTLAMTPYIAEARRTVNAASRH